MRSKLTTATALGVDAHKIDIEVDLQRERDGFSIIGFANARVQ